MILDLFGTLYNIHPDVYAMLLFSWFVLIMFSGLYFDGAFVHVER